MSNLKNKEMKDLIEEAKNRIDEIVEKSKESWHTDSYLAIYESDNGYTIGWIKRGMGTRTNIIAFGCTHNKQGVTKEEIENAIWFEEEFM